MKVLDKSKYQQVLAVLANVDINHYFAKSVIMGDMNGVVYVDDESTPSSFYIATEFGMSLLFGSLTNQAFNLSLTDYLLNKHKDRSEDEWLQVYPEQWNKKLKELCKDKLIAAENSSKLTDTLDAYPDVIIENTRVNFQFDKDSYFHKLNKQILPSKYTVIELDETWYQAAHGSVVVKNFWQSSDKFLTKAKGFCVIATEQDETKPVAQGKGKKEVFVASAFAATVDEHTHEIGIETNVQYRNKGFARLICQHFIEYCLAKKITPIWACRLENTASYHLAQSLGFKPTKYIPYYRLAKNCCN